MEKNTYEFKILNGSDYRLTIYSIAKGKMVKVALKSAINGINMISNKKIDKNTEMPEYFEVPKNYYNLVNSYLKNGIKNILIEEEKNIKKKFNREINLSFPFLKEGKYKKVKDELEMTITYEGIYKRKC